MLKTAAFWIVTGCTLIGGSAKAGESVMQDAERLVKALSGPDAGRIRDARLDRWWRDAKFGLFIDGKPLDVPAT